MRIIAGFSRGRKLRVPNNDNIRPTSDRVKEAVFSMIAFDIPGKRVLDLFAGTGSLGLEALSRGASYSVFVDSSRDALNLVRENITSLGYKEKSAILFMDALKAIGFLEKKGESFNIVFVDPPYRKGLYEDVIGSLADSGIMHEGCLIIIEHPEDLKLDEIPKGMQVYKGKKYGNTRITILKREDTNENSSLSGQF